MALVAGVLAAALTAPAPAHALTWGRCDGAARAWQCARLTVASTTYAADATSIVARSAPLAAVASSAPVACDWVKPSTAFLVAPINA